MKIVFRKSRADAIGCEYPGLTDGKEYEVLDTVRDDEAGTITHYYVLADEETEEDYALPYEIEIFDGNV